jgi:hypothetical protein
MTDEGHGSVPGRVSRPSKGSKQRHVFEPKKSAQVIDAWFTTKVIEFILGPMAEAKLLGKSFDDVFGDYSSEDDFDEIVLLSDLCGKTQREIAEAVVESTGMKLSAAD